MIKKLLLVISILIYNLLPIIAQQDNWLWEKISLPSEVNTLRIFNAKQIKNGNVLITCLNNKSRYGLSNGLWVLNPSADSVIYSFPEMSPIIKVIPHDDDVYAMFKPDLDNYNSELYRIKNIIKSNDNGKTWNSHRFIFRIDTVKINQWETLYDTLTVATNLLSVHNSILVATCWHRPIIGIRGLRDIERSTKPKLYVFKSYDNGKSWTLILNKELQCTNAFVYCSGNALLYDKNSNMIYLDIADYQSPNPVFYRFSLNDSIPQTVKAPEDAQLSFENEPYLACTSSLPQLYFLQDSVYVQRHNPIDTLFRNCLMYGTLPVFDTDGKIFIRYPFFWGDVFYDKSHFFVSADTGKTWGKVGTPFDSTLHFFTVLKNGTYLLQTYSLDTYSSDDKGKTWRKLQWNIDKSGINAITFDNQRRIYVGTNAAHGVVRSSQITFKWEYLGGKHKTQSHVLVESDGTIYRTQRDAYDDCDYDSDDLYNFHRMYRKFPGSSAWDTVYIEYQNGLKGISFPRDVKQTQNGDLFIIGRFCVQRSTDKGNSWTYFENCDEGSSSTLIELGDGSILLGGVFYPRLWKNGKWTTIKDVPTQGASNAVGYRGIVYSKKSSKVFMRPDFGGRSEFNRDYEYYYCPLYISKDNAVTWDSLELYDQNKPFPGDFLVLDSLNNLYLYSEGNAILRSTDEGKTWNDITANLLDNMSYLDINTMSASPEGWIYVGTATHGLWRSKQRFPPVGIDDKDIIYSKNSAITITPNPADNTITVIGADNMLNNFRISDITGRVMYEGREHIIDISAWAQGMYALTLQRNNSVITHTFCIIR